MKNGNNNNKNNIGNKSIFDYVTDNSLYINVNAKPNYEPMFIINSQTGIPAKNIDTETILRGTTKDKYNCPIKK